MKKVGIVLLVCSLLGSAAGAATDTTAAKQIDWLENAIYGSVRSGGLISRLDSVRIFTAQNFKARWRSASLLISITSRREPKGSRRFCTR